MIEEFDSLEFNEEIDNNEYLEFNLEVESEETILFSKISTYIAHEACRLYIEHFKNYTIPVTFIEFIFNEYKKYPFKASSKLNDYFKQYQDDKIELITDTYSSSIYSMIIKKVTKKTGTHYKLSNNVYSQISMANANLIDFDDDGINNSLNNVTKHFTSSDELLTLKELYENYIIKKELRSYAQKQLQKQYDAMISTTADDVPDQIDNYLVGSQTDLPNQTGKVVKVAFPKLSLPSPYPMTQEKSRINSEHRIYKFTKVDDQVKLINKYKINGVKYRQAFIEKRKLAQKPAKRKFDFDF